MPTNDPCFGCIYGDMCTPTYNRCLAYKKFIDDLEAQAIDEERRRLNYDEWKGD